MLSALKEEILNKKRILEENKMINDKRKYFRRADLDKILYGPKENSEEVVNNDKNEEKAVVNNPSSSKVDEIVTLSRVEVIKRFRERGEPILLFNESELESFKRLRKLEILEPEINRGFRNDFQEALEHVDQAYLNEILKNKDGKEGCSSKESSLDIEEYSMSDIQELAKKLEKRNDGNNDLSCEIILNFIQLIIKTWNDNLNERKEADKMSVRGKMDSATFTQTISYLKPLTKKLKKRNLPEDILECLTEIVVFCLNRNYVKANDVYLQMAIGNAPWPIGVTMVGIHARTGREKIFSKHVAHVLNDEAQRKYIQGIKRLITKCQNYFIADPSKCVEYQAVS